MMTDWTKNLKDAEDKKKFENNLRGSKIILERLDALLNEYEADLERTELATSYYESAGWAAKLAHANGQRAVYRKIKSLINLDQ